LKSSPEGRREDAEDSRGVAEMARGVSEEQRETTAEANETLQAWRGGAGLGDRLGRRASEGSTRHAR
jgi:hypothetical protein